MIFGSWISGPPEYRVAMPTPVNPDTVRTAPKVLLHDHLDGGLRPQTVIELADATGYSDLPATEPEALGNWFRDAADSGSLVRYLETFAHTCAVMQDEPSLIRVAAEAVEDLADDGVVYAEVRYAPELFVERRSRPGRDRADRAGGLP